ncbi:cytochrome P450 [Jackrogersella minutella]|nr:cytochrome P450 [Jackrogersella minutella]
MLANPSYVYLGTAVSGVIFHLSIFIRGEWHMQAPTLATTYDASSYVIGLFASIIVYRKCFHRLCHFSGSWIAGATKVWHLRKQYGPVIRTGPEDLTIIDAAVPPAIDGPGNECTNAVWYDFLLPEIALNTTRSIKDHNARRRTWDRGFSPKTLDTYEERVVEYAETLTAQIEKLAHTGAPFNRWHFAVRLLRKAMSLLGPFSPVPWIAQMAFYITPWMYIVRDWLAMMQWCRDRISERIQAKVRRLDVSHWLIDASLQKGSLEADREWLNGDAVTIIIAGSDTIAPTLVFAFYELARKHRYIRSCSASKLFSPNGNYKRNSALYPPVPTGGYRQSPPSGMTINDIYIPGNVTIVTPRYPLARLDSSYECADQLVPERWTSRPEMVKDTQGVAPFSQGRFNCVGKSLAMSEMRFVIALLMKKFKVEFWGDDKGEKLFAYLRDRFTAAPGRLDLRFRVKG